MSTSNMKLAPFYPGLISDQDQEKIRQSDLWPIILSLHFNTGGKIFVSDLQGGITAGKIFMRTKQGANILGIKKDSSNGEVSIHLSADIILPKHYKNNLVFSVNPKYIVNKLKQDGEVIQKINQYINQVDIRILPETLTKLVQNFSRNIKESGTEVSVNMDVASQEYAVRALLEGDKLTTNPNIINDLKDWHAKIQAADIKKARYKKKYEGMFSPLKHLVIFINPHLYITGQVKAVCRETDYKITCATPQELTLTNDLTTQPELMASLAFWKILREGRKGEPKMPTIDSAGMLINNTSHIDQEAGSMVVGADEFKIYLIHKTGEQ